MTPAVHGSLILVDLRPGPSVAISPHLHRKLQEKLGTDAGDDLAARLKDMEAIHSEIAELRHEMQLGFARMDARFAKLEGFLEAGLARGDARLEKGLRDQTRFFFLAWAVQLAAIIGLYTR